ncbi:NDP-hexose 2,3-dehydratase family protein [Kibdelosporangium philippinense]|uniref:NDP-hexose 2,3-dehydratase family protein n=1 Tax=Kibdelosporangium philippinense TaxID=211113 RepID=A0ABS8Z2X7_9PSEU|nr:NDP-hexose 2,3-dehydratase family protein [Kibdelosporangium philippinense]MCE7002286.1 NDP-hexose 2,3-dehydratase family protein [Kibdelosporangium philippinense]
MSGSLFPVRLADTEFTGAEHDDVHAWLERCRERVFVDVRRIPLDELVGWHTDPDTGNLVHGSGKFFTIEGIDVTINPGPVPHWRQPIIDQPEVGILGILMREINGTPHLLMQAKVEPGNVNGIQLSPTVQATRSNYTRVHGGRQVPYLDYFLRPGRRRVVADVRQSEQGSAFRSKRNRNIVVKVTEEVPAMEGFRWMTLGQVHRLLAEDDLINMDARTVLACLPVADLDMSAMLGSAPDRFQTALTASLDPARGARHTMPELLSWITEARIRTEVGIRRVPLRDLPGWRRTAEKISHETGAFFDVIGVDVTAGGREVAHWTQPMVEPYSTGVVAFAVREFDGVLHVLMNTRVEAGLLDVAELAPTVQCTPGNYEHLPASARPPFLDEVLRLDPAQIRYSAVLSEEGGRFFHARNRYLIAEMDLEVSPDHPDYRWVAVHQLAELLRHSHYVNIQARSMIACLHSLMSPR